MHTSLPFRPWRGVAVSRSARKDGGADGWWRVMTVGERVRHWTTFGILLSIREVVAGLFLAVLLCRVCSCGRVYLDLSRRSRSMQEVPTYPATNPLQFCNECGFMLKPKGVYERREAGGDTPWQSGLVNYCAKCKTVASEEQRRVDSCVVYANVIVKDDGASLQVFSNDLVSDPTLMSTKNSGKPCENCGHRDHVFFMSHSEKRGQEMSLVFICKNCNHKWLTQGDPVKWWTLYNRTFSYLYFSQTAREWRGRPALSASMKESGFTHRSN